MNIVYFKNAFIERSKCRISLNDRSFRFGDGLFESMLVVNGKVYDLPAHITRLSKGLKALRIALNTKTLPALCAELIRRNHITTGTMRILVSRGEDVDGARYLPHSSKPYLLIEAFAKPYPALSEIKLWQSSQAAHVITLSKTNNALTYVLSQMQAETEGCDNALLLDCDGNICETATGNIFWVSSNTLFCPADSLPFIPGTMRGRVLKLWKGKLTQGYFTTNALKMADEIFMTGSGGIISAIVEIKPLGIKRPIGEHTRKLRALLDKEILAS